VKKLLAFIIAATFSITAFALPQGKPFQEIQGMIDMLAGDVGDLEGRVTALENQLALLSLDVVGNADAIAAIEDEIDVIDGILLQKQKILNGTCASGTVIHDFDGQGNLTCVQVGNTVTKFLVHAQRFIAPNSVVTTTVVCPAGSTAMGGAFSFIGGTRSTILNAANFRAVNNPVNLFAIAIISVSCLDID
jgi:hypothetical protein